MWCGVAWYALVRTLLKYCDKYSVLHQSTGAAKHKLAIHLLLFHGWEDTSRVQASPELPSSNEGNKAKAPCLSFGASSLHDNPEKYSRVFLAERRKFFFFWGHQQLSCSVFCHLEQEIRKSTWIPFFFFFLFFNLFYFVYSPWAGLPWRRRLTVYNIFLSEHWNHLSVLRRPERDWPADPWAGKLDLKYFSSEDLKT